MRQLIALALFLLTFSCQKDNENKLPQGMYRATLDLSPNEELPFNFKVREDNKIEIYNAEEVILIDEATYRNDSVFINFPIYEGYIAGVFNGFVFKGEYIKESLDRIVPFTAKYNEDHRFKTSSDPVTNVSGVWEVVFSEGIEDDEYIPFKKCVSIN